MPTYISLVNWTDQGLTNIKDTSEQAERSAEVAEKHGASQQLPDDEAATAYDLEIRSAGKFRTTMLRAYNREEISGIIGRLG